MKTLLKVWRGLLACIGYVIIVIHAGLILILTFPLLILAGQPRSLPSWYRDVKRAMI